MEKFTWNDLANAIAKLPEDQREKQVLLSFEDESHFRHAVELVTIPEDIYVNTDDNEDIGPINELKEVHGDDFKEEDYKLCTPKGTAFIADSFLTNQ